MRDLLSIYDDKQINALDAVPKRTRNFQVYIAPEKAWPVDMYNSKIAGIPHGPKSPPIANMDCFCCKIAITTTWKLMAPADQWHTTSVKVDAFQVTESDMELINNVEI